MSDAVTLTQIDANHVVAANVRAELSRERWTGRKAATALGLTQPYLARRLSGEVPLDPADLVMLSGLLRVPIARFFAGTTKSPEDGASGLRQLPDMDSNHEPTHSSLAPVSSLSEKRRERGGPTAAGAAEFGRDAVVTTLVDAV